MNKEVRSKDLLERCGRRGFRVVFLGDYVKAKIKKKKKKKKIKKKKKKKK
jgi:hypothetical protein